MSYRAQEEVIVGPLKVIPLCGEYVVIDCGAGNRVLRPRFKSRLAAAGWLLRHGGGDHVQARR